MDSTQCAPAASALLTSPAFVLAVSLLAINDWVLKAAVGGWLTGKLSDFAGLFAFPLFWSALLPRRRAAVHALTAAGFLLWKSPLSEPALSAWNALGLWPLARVVDYSDWVALAALLPSWRLAGRTAGRRPVRPPRATRRAAAVASAGLAVLAFAATSKRPPRHDLGDRSGYLVESPRPDVWAALRELGLEYSPRSALRVTAADTIFIILRGDSGPRAEVTAELRDAGAGQTIIRPLDAVVWSDRLSDRPDLPVIRRSFLEQVIEPLRARVSRARTPEG